MKLITKVFSEMYRNRSFPQVFVFMLIITSLFACGLDVTENSTSANAKNPEQSQLNHNTLPQSISQAVLRDASRVSGIKSSDLQISCL